MWRLQVLDWAGTGQWQWRWRLLDDAGAYVTDHQVSMLDKAAWQFDAFTNLHNYLKWAASPDRRWAHQAELVEQVGEWVGHNVLGPRIGSELARRRGPVRIEVPDDAQVLGYLPWELARVNGRSLAEHRTNLVIVPARHDVFEGQPGQVDAFGGLGERDEKRPVGERLRMLAVFSLPVGVGALNLRKERVALAKLVQRIARVNNRAIELRVLQYGATRGRLEDAIEEAEGWDVVHLSGHGLAGGLVLEKSDGRHDVITSDDLVALLDRGRDQIKLVTMSACESAAVTAAEHLHQLGLGPAVRDTPGDADVPPSSDGQGPAPAPATVLPAVAAALVAGLDCAVLAMRYPVVDDFAIALTGSFYDLLLGKDQPVARALALSLTQRTVVSERATPATPALSVGTPVLFGPRAADLTLTAPAGQGAMIDTGTSKLAVFPDQPVRFVGRVEVLTRASQRLAPESRCPGVVLHGMAGAGKTACALELAYTHHQSFPLMAWFAAPEETPGGAEIRPVLASFALATERQLPNLQWAHLVDNPEQLRAFLPQLTQMFEDNRVLLALDNIESLLTDGGEWRDERWAWVLAALTDHSGLSRGVVTTRRLPIGLPATVLIEPVHALSLAESVLLARELPNLGGLIGGIDLPTGSTQATGRELVRRILGVVQGHPKLLELADGAAIDPAELGLRLADADAAWLARGTRLEGFLSGDAPMASGEDFGVVLAGWARSAAAGLPDAATLLLRVVCGLEETDRVPNVLDVVWPQVWERTDQAGAVPDLDAVMPVFAVRALVGEERDPSSGAVVGWRVHPGVADAVRADTDPGFAGAIDEVAGDGWMATLRAAESREAKQQEGARVVRAARSAAPYLLRRYRWRDLDDVALLVLARDLGVGAAVVLAPMLQVAAEATRGDDVALELSVGRNHARAVLRLDPARGVALMEELLDKAVGGGHYGNASALASDLVNRYQDEGRYDDALVLADRKIDYARRAGFGPWTQLADHTQRLQIEYLQGRYRQVLDEVEALQAQMVTLPAQPDPATESVVVWNVREAVLNAGVGAALRLGMWERALELNAENLASLRGRGASALEQARDVFNDFSPLVRLGQLAQARKLLIGCRDVFEQADDIPNLGKTLSALADVEITLGHRDRAVDLEREALRFIYTAADPAGVGVSHHNLATYLHDSGADPRLVGVHRVAAAVIAYQIGSGDLHAMLAALGRLLAADGVRVPRSFTQVCALVGQIPGVDLPGLLARLPRRAADAEAAVAVVLAAAPDAAAAQRGRVEQSVAGWEPVLSALHAAAVDPDPNSRAAAATTLTAELDRYADSEEWRALAAVLGRIHAGERDAEMLLDGLDAIDTAIARRALDIVAGTATVDPDAWRTPDDQSDDDPPGVSREPSD